MSDLAYPKSGAQFLLPRIAELHGQIADLIDELVKRDQTIAELTAKLPKPDAPDGNPAQ
jgi:hypothetical protein